MLIGKKNLYQALLSITLQSSIIQSHFYLISRSQKKKNMIQYDNKNPWISEKLKADIALREKILIISKKIPTELNIQKYKSFKNRNLADQRAAERAHYKEQFGIFGDDLKKSFRVLRKLICKDNGHNMTNSIYFIIHNQLYQIKLKLPMDLMTILLMWAVHYLAIFIAMLIHYLMLKLILTVWLHQV